MSVASSSNRCRYSLARRSSATRCVCSTLTATWRPRNSPLYTIPNPPAAMGSASSMSSSGDTSTLLRISDRDACSRSDGLRASASASCSAPPSPSSTSAGPSAPPPGPYAAASSGVLELGFPPPPPAPPPPRAPKRRMPDAGTRWGLLMPPSGAPYRPLPAPDAGVRPSEAEESDRGEGAGSVLPPFRLFPPAQMIPLRCMMTKQQQQMMSARPPATPPMMMSTRCSSVRWWPGVGAGWSQLSPIQPLTQMQAPLTQAWCLDGQTTPRHEFSP
mmetsp:Transcript_16393/g.52129  ORF Transcript_16393/g.52129 Transcript_16393/m.52129 type:complete len:273 (-) Transcript_16393:675-1493(-)